ncbi:MAG TPA: 4-hydroxythreonine-4-phosphate dehydrogenase PdxA [Myxococcota bacterium]|nr:4-hydroxythreonine-4-phosphate dehydrogenase PdxA [Myxococcota bacterium]
MAIIPGASDGVGPELLLKALTNLCEANVEFLWCGDKASLQLASDRARIAIDFFDSNKAKLDKGPILQFFDEAFGASVLEAQANFIKKGVTLAKNHQVDALVTGPIDKACLRYLDDGNDHGQTEYFSRHLAAPAHHRPLMAFMGGPFLMSLVTTHVPLRSVAHEIHGDVLLKHIESVAAMSAPIVGKEPNELRIAVLGLNPHAGEGGLIGEEEQEIMLPTIKKAQDKGLKVSAPLPADGFFAYFHRMDKDFLPDIVIAMYHDQGLIPYKLLAQGCAVNVTLGLTIPRVSPAHGTASNLTGKNLACPKSTQNALETALLLSRLRMKP